MRNFIVLGLLITFANLGFAQRAVPALWGHRVHDEAQILTAATVDALELMLKAHEDSTTNQIAVLIIPSLDGDVLEDYSLRVAEEWKLGKEKNDNGVLLLVVVDDRKMRIEVGHGLEGALPDAICNRIIRNEIAPHFREQNYEEGIRSGLNAIIKAIGGEYVDDQSSEADQLDLTWKERLFIGAFVFGILGIFTVLGIFIPGCMGWFLYAFLIPFYAIFPMAVVGVNGGIGVLITYLIAFPILKLILGRTSWGKKMSSSMGNTRRRSGSGWTSGSGWFTGGGSGGGWSSGGGGFSGGGGSFGGGGSSGSW